ncbi:ABC transporter substrate-binding protein [Prochlorococcus sp. MIT 1300]|uniref:ABC transporter substrate-binding protein n=1 Tax=Prochlorococcus sp. MIT 1300 TaxID=3096218 RepID=UPI002A759B43|nr:ABC transporter substrate-binding protein [Prochlorococcus sp. MIT 1300]
MASPETVPKYWRQVLPIDWRYKPLSSGSEQKPFDKGLKDADLLALGDGWLMNLPIDRLKPIDADLLKKRLGFQAQSFLEGLNENLSSRVLPVGVSPWALLFRNGDYWQDEASNGWDVLLDQKLKGLIVMPESPLLVMSIAQRIKSSDALKQLVAQVYSFDDRNALNWLLKDKARVAILPVERCFGLLRRDPRLKAILPNSGSPLHWTVLTIPASSGQKLPKEWVEAAWDSSLTKKLLSEGWLPPLPYEKLSKLVAPLPFKDALLPSQTVWDRCWSIPQLTFEKQKELLEVWNQSFP